MRKKLGALHQELDGEEATEAAANGSIKEKLKECVDQSQVAFHRIRMERECFQNQIDKLTKEKLELENKVEALEQQGITVTLNLPNYLTIMLTMHPCRTTH